MWTSSGSEIPTSASVTAPQPQSLSRSEIQAEPSFSAKQTPYSMIGKSILIKGEIAASEPIYILGSVEGTILALGDRVTIEKEGKVNADISAREVVIMGEVCGNIDGADRVEIRKGGSLTGNLAAHRISIEDGAFLTGAVDVRTPIEKKRVETAPLVEMQLAGD